MSLEVHSSYKSLGTKISPKDFLIELQRIITPSGNIVMPSFPLSKKLKLNNIDHQLGILSKCKWLPEDHTEPSDMGVLSDTFRLGRNVLTGLGKHRMSAWGCKADQIVSDFNSILKYNGYALLIGVDIRQLTAMHLVEHYIPDEIWPKLFTTLDPEIEKLYPSDKYFITTEELPKYHKGWLRIQRIAVERNVITWGNIGRSDSMFFKLKDVLDIYKSEIRNNIHDLYGV